MKSYETVVTTYRVRSPKSNQSDDMDMVANLH